MRSFANPMTLILIAFMAYSAIKSGSFDSPMDWLISELLCLPGIVIGLSFHEFAHAYAADRLGDNTPRMQGRVSISPLAHIDIIGLICLIFVGFGWGKPVEINPNNFRHRRRDEFWVSIAGVLMNLFIAVVATIVLRFYIRGVGDIYEGTLAYYILQIILNIVYINLVLMIFNLLPIPPLDGFNIITQIFNLQRYRWWYWIYDKGFIILMILIVFNFTSAILTPCINALWGLLSNLL